MAQKLIVINRGAERVIRGNRRINRGSKQALLQIRWKASEMVSLILFAMLLLGVVIALLRLVSHEHPDSEPPNHPQIRDTKHASILSRAPIVIPRALTAKVTLHF